MPGDFTLDKFLLSMHRLWQATYMQDCCLLPSREQQPCRRRTGCQRVEGAPHLRSAVSRFLRSRSAFFSAFWRSRSTARSSADAAGARLRMCMHQQTRVLARAWRYRVVCVYLLPSS